MLRDRYAEVQNDPVLDWDDLRYFFAVARAGSTLSAGRNLRVSQTTVARRILGLERSLGLTLFDRRPAGYTLTHAGVALFDHAGNIERAIAGLENAAAAQERDICGIVRITTSDIFAVTILPAILRDLHQAWPSIRIELDTSDLVRDLGAEADIALRTCIRPDGGGLVGRRVADASWTTYCSRGYAAEHGLPRRRSELRNRPIIGGGDEGVWRYYRQWLADNDLLGAIAMQQSSSTGLLASVRAGFGIAVLPCIVADNDPDLLRCLPPSLDNARSLWLLTHERLRQTPRIRTVLDFLAPRLTTLNQSATGA